MKNEQQTVLYFQQKKELILTIEEKTKLEKEIDELQEEFKQLYIKLESSLTSKQFNLVLDLVGMDQQLNNLIAYFQRDEPD